MLNLKILGHGFHAYIDEMNLDYVSSSLTQDPSQVRTLKYIYTFPFLFVGVTFLKNPHPRILKPLFQA